MHKAHDSSWQDLQGLGSEERRCGRRARQQFGRPVQTAVAQPSAGEARRPGITQHTVDVALVLRRGRASEGERNRPQVEVE
ncbi:hypothetical protein D3C72_2069360 [compost metagenome]